MQRRHGRLWQVYLNSWGEGDDEEVIGGIDGVLLRNWRGEARDQSDEVLAVPKSLSALISLNGLYSESLGVELQSGEWGLARVSVGGLLSDLHLCIRVTMCRVSQKALLSIKGSGVHVPFPPTHRTQGPGERASSRAARSRDGRICTCAD